MRREVAAIGALGVGLRTASALASTPADDAREYARLASDLSWLHPWAASRREPLWVVVDKLVSAPFGYDVNALQGLSWVLSVVALWVCWRLASRHLGVGAVVAFAVVALHPLLIADAGMGIREPAVLTLCALIAGWLLDGRALPAGLAIGALVSIRWEVGLLWVAIALVAVVGRQVGPRVLAVAAAVAVVVLGPFLVANRVEYRDAMFHSNIHAVYYRNLEDAERKGEDAYALPRYRGEPITWADYYLHYVGPRRAVRRIAEGAVRIPTEVGGFGITWVGVVATAVAVATGLTRRTRLAVGSLMLIAGGTLGYAALSRVLSYRLVSFLVLPFGLLLGMAVDSAFARRRHDVHRRATADAPVEHGDVADVARPCVASDVDVTANP